MKKYFCETNGCNLLVILWADGRAMAFDCETLERAKEMDCSGVEGFEDAEEAAINCNKSEKDLFAFDESEFENITEI